MKSRSAFTIACAVVASLGVPAAFIGVGIGSAPLAIAGAGAFVVGFAVMGTVIVRERRAAQRAIAAEGDYLADHGFAVGAFDSQALLSEPIPLFAKGREAAGDHLMSSGRHSISTRRVGEVEGKRIGLAAYSITTTRTSADRTDSYTEWFTVAACLVDAEIAPFSLERESVVSRRLGGEVKLGHERFDRSFRVSAAEPDLLRQWLDVELMERLLMTADDVQVGGSGRHVVAWRPGAIEEGPVGPVIEAAASVAARVAPDTL